MRKKRMLTGVLLSAAVMAVAGCSGQGAVSGETAKAPADPADASGTIKVLTQRTDLVQDGTMDKYAAEFRKIYPKVKVTFEALTGYEQEVKIRMSTEDYGDVLMVPTSVAKNDYPKFFAPLGSAGELGGKYRFSDKAEVSGKVYGISTFGTTYGFLYNKAVWKSAGITDWPTSPQEFVGDLKAIKAKTDSMPYYTNFKDGWPLTGWSNNIGSPTCDAKANDKLAGPVSPWRPGSDLRTVDSLLYDIVAGGLSEKDPNTTNWETSKDMFAQGKVATMQSGSWAITQMRAAATKAGADPDDIGFMPFPARKNGKHCAVLTSDYQQAVNIHSGHKAAARAWIDWFTEKSGFAAKEGTVSALRSSPMPDTLKSFVDNDVTFVERSEARTGVVNTIDNAAEIGLNKPDYRQKLIDTARGVQRGSSADFFADLDKRWNEAAATVGS
ncbi:ABC transporter substrate-binding protein [Streptomyces sp. NPDC002067]